MPLPVTPSGKGIERVDRSGQLAAEEFRLLVEGVKDYAIFLLDADGYVASWNPGAERIKGYTAPEILGEHFSRFYPEEDRAAGLPAKDLAEAANQDRSEGYRWRVRKDGSRFYTRTTITALNDFIASVHRDDRMPVLDAIRRAAGDGTPFRLEHRIVGPKGDIRVLVSWGRVMHDGRSSPSRVAVVFQDVTDQRQRDERLAEASLQAELARQLQRGLLPTLSLHDSGLPIQTRYRPGVWRALIGADFYDALELPDGTVATLIGDVAGHGPDGAAVGVALRAAWRALTLTGHGLGEVLDGLHEVLVRDRPTEEMFTTVCCLRISPD